MKRLTKKIMVIWMSLLMISAMLPANAFAAEKTMDLTLRIEGIEENIFYDEVEVPYTDTLTLQAALAYIDLNDESIRITGVDTAYITDINGETAGQFGGWDGWLYLVNGAEASVGIDGLQLSDGDSIVLYYGDPFGAGMQYPAADTSDIREGIIRFTSADTTYDADFNATVTVNPVVDATVILSNGNETTNYVTNERGEISMDKAQLVSGAYTLQISKISDAGIPLVLRYAPDYTIKVDVADTDTDSKVTDSDVVAIDGTTAKENRTGSPKTGDNSNMLMVLFGIGAAGSLLGVIYYRRKELYEK